MVTFTGVKEAGIPDRPSIRDKAAMVYYDNAVWVFAGWGTRIDRTQHNSTVSLALCQPAWLALSTQILDFITVIQSNEQLSLMGTFSL